MWFGLSLLLVLYLLILVVVMRLSMMPPRLPLYFHPGQVGLSVEDFFIDSFERPLAAWWVPCEGARAVVVLSHGYCMNRSEVAAVVPLLHSLGCSCLLYDFPAHGRTRGGRCTLGVNEAAAVVDAIAEARRRSLGLPLILFGSSMGAAATVLACKGEVGQIDGLILDSMYGRLRSAIGGWWYFLGRGPLQIFLSPTVLLAPLFLGFDPSTVDMAGQVVKIPDVPKLFLHGARDTLATPEEAKRVIVASGESATVHWLEGMNHCEGRWERPAEYNEAIRDFVERILK